MKKFLKNLIYGIIVTLMFGSFTGSVFAIDTIPLVVNFSATPLFSEANFVPGNEVVRTVGVVNYSDTLQAVIVEAINAVDIGGLGDKLNLVIKEGDVVLYNNTLGTFLRNGEVSLSPLATGVGTTYSFNVTFDSSANNDTQNTTLGFDLCVGFSGGDKSCGDTVIGAEEEGGTGGGGIIPGIGGSNGSTPTSLNIFDEQAFSTFFDQAGTATITWDTNKLATSQVVYGLASGGPYNLVLTSPNFGYPSSTVENLTKVINHSVVLTGLTTGQTYVYRVVSRASPPTVSPEHQFTAPLLAQAGNNTFTNGINNGANVGTEQGNVGNTIGRGGRVAGITTGETTGNTLGTTTGKVLNNNLAAIGSLLDLDFWDLLSGRTLIALLILLLVYLVWSFWLRQKI